MKNDVLKIADREFNSRLFTGTGKFSSPVVMQEALNASECAMVTVALRRIDLENPQDPIINYIDKEKHLLLPNTSGARDAEEAVRLAKIAEAGGGGKWLKLEVIPDVHYLLPDPIETLKATEKLVKLGFIVLPYIQADPVLAKHLEEAGAATVMPLAAPIGTNKGIKTLEMLKIIIEQANVPVVVDAGIGLPSHAAQAMELGADAVLVNTAIATAQNPTLMANAFKNAVIAGREAFLAGKATVVDKAQASSPLTGFLRD